MAEKNDVVDTLEYRGYHIDFYNDDYGQQVYNIHTAQRDYLFFAAPSFSSSLVVILMSSKTE